MELVTYNFFYFFIYLFSKYFICSTTNSHTNLLLRWKITILLFCSFDLLLFCLFNHFFQLQLILICLFTYFNKCFFLFNPVLFFIIFHFLSFYYFVLLTNEWISILLLFYTYSNSLTTATVSFNHSFTLLPI